MYQEDSRLDIKKSTSHIELRYRLKQAECAPLRSSARHPRVFTATASLQHQLPNQTALKINQSLNNLLLTVHLATTSPSIPSSLHLHHRRDGAQPRAAQLRARRMGISLRRPAAASPPAAHFNIMSITLPPSHRPRPHHSQARQRCTALPQTLRDQQHLTGHDMGGTAARGQHEATGEAGERAEGI